MSVSVESPLHFQSSQPPSSPPFSSPPQSPTHRLHAQAPASPPPPPAIDVDMSMSVTTLAPAGQRHDRDDADMQDGDGLVNGHDTNTTEPSQDQGHLPSTVAVEVAAIDEDAMDTTPDPESAPVLPGDLANPFEASVITPSSPNTLTAATEPDSGNNIPVPPVASSVENPIESIPPIDPPPPIDPASQPPPPPPPVEPIRSDSDSSDDDDGVQPWHPMQEDTSSPDEAELKEIEASTEHSALDHEYWGSTAFLPLEDPEYTAGASGRLHWDIDAYNGTREKPNRDIVMKSNILTVGGYEWQIKFYPKGNDSDYLSVYLECLSVMKKKEGDEGEKKEDGDTKESDANDTTGDSKQQNAEQVETAASDAAPIGSPIPEAPVETQHAPLPLLGDKSLPKRKSVAAQVAVVLYNPSEPRVNYYRTALHRFCAGSPDWGWTRFHGPYYDIAHRMRNQRQALLRDDKLAFTAYIRVVEDETNCLWEHHSRENPWDSFAMSGLQSLVLGQDISAPGGNMISAVALWLLFKPFRHLLYSIDIPDPVEDPLSRPKPLLCAFQKVLYMLRTFVEPGDGPVSLNDVLDALDWYHIHDRLNKLDVMEVWEVLRAKLEEELQGTQQSASLEEILGAKRDYTAVSPKYRVPVIGMESMQQAVNSSANFLAESDTLPQLLTIELGRQEFDTKSRSYVKILNKVTLDDHITVKGTPYTLYGFVVHKQTLQSNVYQPVIRPEGPGSRWYIYSDSKEENQVKCLTQRQAINDHEGKAGKDRVIGNDSVAYIVTYIRDDIAETALVCDPKSDNWNVPEWIKEEVKRDREASDVTPIPPLPLQDDVVSGEEKKSTDEGESPPAKQLDFHVISSEAFSQHEGPGLFDAYDQKWHPGNSEHVKTIQLSSRSNLDEVRNNLATLYPDIQEPRQIVFWFVDSVHGVFCRPQLLGTGKVEFSRGSYDRFKQNKDWTLEDVPAQCRRIWVHIVDADSLPELPKVEEKTEEKPVPESVQVAEETQEVENQTETQAVTEAPPEDQPHGEDTLMSDPEDDPPAQPEVQQPLPDGTQPPVHASAGDTAMVEVESAQIPDPPTVDVVVPDTAGTGDTEMSGTQDDASLLPPAPPISIPVEVMHPPPPPGARTPEPPPDEIYFFLKLWDPETQRLEPRGSHIALKSARVDETVTTLLGQPMEDKKKIELWEEEEIITTRSLKHRRTFAQLDLHNTTIIIASLPITPDQRSALAAKALPADPQSFLAHSAFSRNFPDKLNGHVTYPYFSDEYYKGEICNGHSHGHGTRIYHSGATYTGSFRLGARHGHGLYTFQNGDTYDGEWVDNQQQGTGTFVEAATGNTYVGGWKNDKKFGEGVTHWKNAQEEERMCRICWDEAADAAFYDCGHVVACITCAREVQNCPVCRKRVLSAMKLYYVA